MPDETVYLPQGVPGGRYWNVGAQRYENSVGQPLDITEQLPDLIAKKASLEAHIAHLQSMKTNEEPVEIIKSDAPPTDYQGKKKWAKEHGREVVFNISNEKLDAIIAEIEAK